MQAINKIPAIREDNPPGLCMIRLISAGDVVEVLTPDQHATNTNWLELPFGGLKVAEGATIIDVYQANDVATFNENLVKDAQGERWRQQLNLMPSHDTAERGRVARALSKNRWIAIVSSSFDTTRLVGMPDQPLKLVDGAMSSSKINWALSLRCETMYPSFYLPSVDLVDIVGFVPFDIGFSLGFES